MQHSPSSQLKINQFLRPVPALQTVDDDCYIVEEGNKKLSIGPTESAVIHAAATPKIHPKIYDNDDDDELMVQPQVSNEHNLTLQQSDGRGGDMSQTHATLGTTATQQPPETQRRAKSSGSSPKAKRRKRSKHQVATSTAAV